MLRFFPCHIIYNLFHSCKDMLQVFAPLWRCIAHQTCWSSAHVRACYYQFVNPWGYFLGCSFIVVSSHRRFRSLLYVLCLVLFCWALASAWRAGKFRLIMFALICSNASVRLWSARVCCKLPHPIHVILRRDGLVRGYWFLRCGSLSP